MNGIKVPHRLIKPCLAMLLIAMPATLFISYALFGCTKARGSKEGYSGSKRAITVLMVPKIKGIDYFNACERGAKEAVKELGGIKLIYEGPTEARVEAQIQLIETWTLRKPDVIAVSCNDPVAISASLKKARQAGIRVLTWDADADAKRSRREFFCNQATFQDVGYSLVDEMVKQVGVNAQVAIVTSSLTAPNQNEWMKWMKRRMQAKYPKMKLVTIQPSEEDQQLAYQKTQEIIRAYPNVKGIFAISSVAFPGAAQAVRDLGKSGKIAVVGLSTPNVMRPFVKDGTVKTVILWNPVDLGYLVIYAARALVDGELKPGMKKLKAGRLGEVEVRGDEIILGPPMKFTRDNIDKFNF
ncbi:MAG: substrate-binding domain-containing protein [Armatimonadota bacterium]|nr:substrate-binding domain-containing protein [Armatimonadota bacterium]MCX7777965.1 substrate-binding domain-containing protein [Armatimonadota bacterium]MDW8025278.1 substrate-binding domain-containing protein [Armatimonadota bacterium]